jgi:hypothetical protein
MKISRMFLLTFFLFIFAKTGHSQQVVLVSGDPSILRGETRLGILFNFDGMSVGKMLETDYKAKKIAEYNQKTPGKGDEWSKSWESDKVSRFQPKFEDMLNKYLNPKGVSASPEIKDSKYSIILKTTFIEPGYNIYVSKQNAMINVEVYIVETANPSNILVKYTIKRIPGRTFMGDDYDTGGRIEEAYAKCGKNLGIYFQKKVFKGK